LIPISAAEAKSPGEIDHDEIGFRFGSGDSMGSLVANDFCPVSRAGARGRGFRIWGDVIWAPPVSRKSAQFPAQV